MRTSTRPDARMSATDAASCETARLLRRALTMATHAPSWAFRTKHVSSGPEQEEQTPRWAWRAGTLAGIRVYVHATFLVLLAWIGLSHLAQGHGLTEAFAGIALVVAVFAIVVLHELG